MLRERELFSVGWSPLRARDQLGRTLQSSLNLVQPWSGPSKHRKWQCSQVYTRKHFLVVVRISQVVWWHHILCGRLWLCHWGYSHVVSYAGWWESGRGWLCGPLHILSSCSILKGGPASSLSHKEDKMASYSMTHSWDKADVGAGLRVEDRLAHLQSPLSSLHW
jgi:hypothetical protein